MRKKILFLLTLLSSPLLALAQTDMTSQIKNPSFEQNLDGWENEGMQAQSNSAFTLKVGNVYCEKWTGKGGKVGDASIQQMLSGLKAGTYTISVVAQNIQEDTPKAVQTGVFVFANENRTSVNVAATYSVQTTICDGELTLGYRLSGATGNYATVDDFHLTLEEPTAETYSIIHTQMQQVVDEAKTVNKHVSSAEQTELDEATTAVETLMQQDTTEGVTEAVVRLKNAIYDYKLSSASEGESIDMTSYINNPSFEKNGMEGWVNKGMQTQTGGVFPVAASGTVFVESWTWGGNHIGDVSVSQRVSLPNGKYVMTARSQNIQQGSNNAASKGGYIFAEEKQTEVGKAKDYTVEFVAIEGQANIGFKTVSATGNWVCVDHFRLTYLGRSNEMLLEALQARITKAEALTQEQMNALVLKNLQVAIEKAKILTTPEGMEQVAITLRECMEVAQTSRDIFASLKQAIDEISPNYQVGTIGAEDFLSAIEAAQKGYTNTETTDAQAETLEQNLKDAQFLYRINNSTGTAPTVTTNKFVARGATGALGRSTVKGSNIMEQGFCWSTHRNPTVLDNRSTKYYENNGKLYLMQPLEPATIYYVRAYAMTKDYAVGYGEERKVITLPMGNSTYWYNWGGSPEENERIDNALKDCIYYYNNWSCTTNFGISCSYGSGTPTADCSYGGSMRVGPNASYQRTGTILHESNHGVVVGQQARWWDTNLHDGEWKGYRANSLLQFLDNNPDERMAGDSMHMWPYGINGASEDSGNPFLYIGNVMITQALHEDGLIPPSHGGCKPAYVFEHEDTVKYYITSEDSKMGCGMSYLTESSTGVLSWSIPAGDIQDNDAYAWYMTYDPARQLYTIRNAKSGKYFSYASGIKTASKSKLTDTEYFHLMVGREAITIGSEKYGLTTRGYWILAGNDVAEPAALTAAASGKTSAPNFDISDGASTQRWLILNIDEVAQATSGKTLTYQNMLTELIKNFRAIQAVPYVENEEGVDSNTTLDNLLDDMERRLETETNADNLVHMYDETMQGGMDYIAAVSVSDIEQPFDLTFLMSNPTLEEDASGWNGDQPAFSYSCAEFFEKSFDLNQTVNNLPMGNYRLTAQGFQRPGPYSSIYSNYAAGKATTNSTLYLVGKTAKLCHICVDGQTKKLGVGIEQGIGSPTIYIPDNMQAAGKYFDNDLYQNEVYYTFTTSRTRNMKMGIKGTNNGAGYWTIFRNFHLYYYGQVNPTGIEEVEIEDMKNGGLEGIIYDLQGRPMRKAAKGIYVQNGKLLMVK